MSPDYTLISPNRRCGWQRRYGTSVAISATRSLVSASSPAPPGAAPAGSGSRATAIRFAIGATPALR